MASQEQIDEILLERIRDWVELVQMGPSFCSMPTEDGKPTFGQTIETVAVHSEGFEMHDDEPTPSKGKARVELVQEITVSRDMCNNLENLHGGCAAYLLDVCTSFALRPWQEGPGWATTGVSSDMHVRFLNPAAVGVRLRLVSKVISVGARLAIIEMTATIKDTGRTAFIGSHSKASLPDRPAKL